MKRSWQGLSLIISLVFVFVFSTSCSNETSGNPDPSDSSQELANLDLVRTQSSQIINRSFDGLSLLFIGNSLTYSNNLPYMLEQMFIDASFDDVRIDSITQGNFGLQDHWVQSGTREKIAQGGWDYVVLQQGPSATEGRPSLLDYTSRFNEVIEASGGQTALYMVWPASQRDFDYDGVLDSYKSAAESVGGLFFPSGEAWREAWKVDPNLILYGFDGFHPSRMGTYLAALVMFNRLTELSSEEAVPLLKETAITNFISEESLELLYQVAVTTNERFPKH